MCLGEKYHPLLFICDWLWENPPLTHKDKYLEICNSIIQSIKCNKSKKLKAACLQFATNAKLSNFLGEMA